MADGTISKIQLPDNTIYDVVDNTSGYMTGMTILSYGSSTWQNFIDAYSSNKVVYCRASSSANPASGSQTRLAFMAYVNNADTPTEVEFQYYRSVSTHTASQQGDQVYVYKLNKTNGWSVTVREASVKVVAGTGLGGTYSNGTMTLTGPTKVSDLTNDSGFITTETDPTVPSWAKESTKPSYNFSEIGSTPTTLSGYGITDASISSGVITLGNDTITPLTSNSTLNAAKLSGAIPSAVTATTQSSTDNSTKIATTAYVTAAIAALPEPMLFKGSVGTGGTITSLPAATTSNEGFTYKVITALSTPVVAKVGDTVISNGSSWVVIPSGDEPSGTVTSVVAANATNGGLTISGSPITSSGTITIGHSNVLTSAQTTQAVYPITIDKNGHISEYGNAVSIPSISLNGSSTTSASFYAPIDAGTSGYYLKSNGSGAPTWAAVPSGTDEKLAVAEVTSDTTYYPIVGSGTTAATRQYDTTGFKYVVKTGTSSANGWSLLILGNNKTSGTAGNKQGYLTLYGENGRTSTLKSGAINNNSEIALPDSSGTLALQEDMIPIGSIPSTYMNILLTTNTADTKNKYYDAQSGLQYYSLYSTGGSQGYAGLVLGNNIANGTAYNARGFIDLYGDSTYSTSISAPDATAARQITLPNKSGTVALTDDIPDVSGKIDTAGTGLSKSGTTLNHSNSVTAQTTQAVYPIKIDKNGHISEYGSAVTIPTVNNATLTIQKNGTTVNTFTANASSNVTANISVPTKVSDLTNDSGFTTKNMWYGTCSTSASTAAKEVTTSSGDFTLTTGSMVRVKFTSSNSYDGTATLNVDGKGAKTITKVSANTTTQYYWVSGEVVDFVYDGTNFVMSGKGTASVTYYGLTKLSSATDSTSVTLAATPKAVKTAYDLANSKQAKLVSGTNIKTINNTSLLGSGDISVAAGGTSTPTANKIAEFDSTAHMNSTDMESTEVNSFIGSLNTTAINAVDYVVEQGANGSWNYTKWNSGKLEQWYRGNPGTYTCGTAKGSWYSGGDLTFTYPVPFVNYPPTITGHVSLGTTAYVVLWQFNGFSLTGCQGRIVSASSVAANTSYNIFIYAVGEWK